MIHKVQTYLEKPMTGIYGLLGGVFLSLKAHIEILQIISLSIGILIGLATLFLKVRQIFFHKDETINK